MDYGLKVVNFTDALIEELKNCPFQLLYRNKKWQLYKYFRFYYNDEEANWPLFIREFKSIDELFLHILQSNEWYCTFSLAGREAIMDCIQFVYFTQNDGKQNFKMRYKCYMQFHQQWTIAYSEAVLPLEHELDEQALFNRLPLPANATEAFLLSRELKYNPSEHRIKQFEDCDNLASWLLREFIEQKLQLALCKNCGCYFIKNSLHRKYCSHSCEKKALKVGSHAGEAEVKRLYRVINQRFERKIKSQSLYNYTGMLANENYNELELFSDIEDKDIKKDPSSATFYNEHFKQMKETYRRLYKKRYKAIKKAKKAYINEECTETAYKEKLDSFLSWLNNVVDQLSAFCLH